MHEKQIWAAQQPNFARRVNCLYNFRIYLRSNKTAFRVTQLILWNIKYVMSCKNYDVSSEYCNVSINF